MPAPLIVLTYWERRHGVELDTAMSQRFMARPEVQELSTMPTRVVIGAIESKGLIHIIIKARELAAAYTPTEEDNWRPSAFSASRSRSTRQGKPKQLFPTTSPATATGAPGTPGSSASYGSGMARNPGVAEAANGYRCSSCGAWVPDAAAHDFS